MSVSPLNTPTNNFKRWVNSCGLTDKDLLNLGIKHITAEEASQFLGFIPDKACAVIPYPKTTFARVRQLFGPKDVVERKYLSPKSSGCSPVYLPPWPGIEWGDIMADPSKPISITEGEVKSYTSCKYGGMVIGIAGTTMSATLFDGQWTWEGRTVSVIFDHDAGQAPGEYKQGVNDALGRLCSQLMAVGANVIVMDIGKVCSDPSRKWGLDDYLIDGGTWEELINTAHEPPEWCALLDELMRTCVFVVGTDKTHIYNLVDGSRKLVGDFHQANISKRRIDRSNPDKPPKVVQISNTWLEHRNRPTALTYELNPRYPFGLREDMINLWRGYPEFKLGSRLKTEQVQGEWQKFMEGLFGEQWEWVATWAAHMLNRPEERCSQAVMLLTKVQGIGKSLFGDILRDLTGVHGLECSSARMFDKFNASMEAKTFVMVNELDVKFNAKEGQLNDLLTEETVSVEPKGKDVFTLANLRRWYLTTNSASPCRLSAGQRRVLVVEPPRVHADTRGEWGDWIRDEIAGFRKDTEALAALRLWFDKIWADYGEGWDSTAPVPRTEAADQLAEASMTTNQILAESLIRDMKNLDGQWGAIHPDLKRLNNTVWGEVMQSVKATGGYVGEKKVKEGGVEVYFTIYDLNGSMSRVRKSSGGHKIQCESVEAKERSDKLHLALEALSERLKR